ncbi:hypothetical protein HMPREF9571_01102 [Cutibacterium acnes HL043PA2]|nr:hypothetical protein HMPREF9571_01102 [Cutibacterium acnes HL043PA2]
MTYERLSMSPILTHRVSPALLVLIVPSGVIGIKRLLLRFLSLLL